MATVGEKRASIIPSCHKTVTTIMLHHATCSYTVVELILWTRPSLA